MSIDSPGCVKVGIWYLRALCVGTLSAFVEQGGGAPGVAGASQAFLLNELLKETSRHQPCATKRRLTTSGRRLILRVE
jgi:hypothetical protein